MVLTILLIWYITFIKFYTLEYILWHKELWIEIERDDKIGMVFVCVCQRERKNERKERQRDEREY